VNSEEYIEGILRANRMLLSKAITLVESTLESDQILAEEILAQCIPYSGKSERIAVSGSPGVGKSTFIEHYGLGLIEEGHKVAVLAIDPSSQNTGGSILGDKTRMEELSGNENAFIRPSPASDALGGVGHKTRESILLCEAAGFNKIIIETVGVGQSEIAASRMSDLYLVLVLAGAGDELQGIKRGIIELADMLVVNKADGDNIDNAKKARRSYLNALHLFPPKPSGQKVEVFTVSSIDGNGMEELHKGIEHYFETAKSNSFFIEKRQKQKLMWFEDAMKMEIQKKYLQKGGIYSETMKKVVSGELHPRLAAKNLIEKL